MNATRICKLENCDRVVECRGWCKLHYSRWQRHGDPTVVITQSKRPCTVKDCAKMAHAHGYCPKHLVRWQKSGDPHVVGLRTGRPLNGEVPTFAAIHKRLSRGRGPAKLQFCVDCGGAAQEWSYRGGAPIELIGKVGEFECAYTEDLTFYDPRCTSCHRKYDDAGNRPRTARGTFAGGKGANATK